MELAESPEAGSSSTGAPDPTDHDALLAFTQAVRLKLAKRLNRSTTVADDPKMMGLMLKAVDGIDKQSLTLKKIASDEGLGNRQATAIEAMVAAFNDPNMLKRMNDTLESAVKERAQTVEVPDDAESITVIPGELSPVGQVDNYDSFMRRVRDQMQGLDEQAAE